MNWSWLLFELQKHSPFRTVLLHKYFVEIELMKLTLDQVIHCVRYLAQESRNASETPLLNEDESLKKLRSLKSLLRCHANDLYALANQLEKGLTLNGGII